MKKEIRKIIKEVVKNVLQENELKTVSLDMYVPDDVWKIKEVLNRAGHKMYIVGGAVRDALYGKKQPKDYDLATDATYDKIQQLFRGEDFVKNLLSIGEQFSINFIVTDSGEYELATFRSDVGGGRKSTVKYEKSLEKDVQRRDLKINALAYDLDSKLVLDYVGGLEDIENGTISAVGNPDDRFLDDPLRKLRAVRFAARVGGDLSPETEASLLKSNSMNDILGKPVSFERRKEEFKSGVKNAISVKHYLDLLEKYNLFEKIFEGSGLKENSSYFVDEKNYIVLLAHILQDNFTLENRINFERALVNLKFSSKNGNVEVPRISFLLLILNLFKNRDSENVNDFLLAKSKYKVVKNLIGDDLKKFAKLNNINGRFLSALITYFDHSLTNDEKREVAEEVGTNKGIEFGNALKTKDFETFKENL